jgi:hypothetical protein
VEATNAALAQKALNLKKGVARKKTKKHFDLNRALPKGVVIAAPVMEGWLWKKAQGLSMLGRSNWKKRWFTLHQGSFRYYDKATPGSSGTMCKGMVEVSQISAVEELADAYDRTHLFQVVHSALLYIEAESAEVAAQWIAALRTVCLTNRVMHRMYHPVSTVTLYNPQPPSPNPTASPNYALSFYQRPFPLTPPPCPFYAQAIHTGKIWGCCSVPPKEAAGCTKAYDYETMKRAKVVSNHAAARPTITLILTLILTISLTLAVTLTLPK